jgi:molybdopterin molybdotransferase
MLTNASWTEARDLLLGLARPVETETIPLDDCAGRVLAFDLKAAEDVPPFDRSAYDGYAFRAEDVQTASKDTPVTLRLTETIPAGSAASRHVARGQAVHLIAFGRVSGEPASAVGSFQERKLAEMPGGMGRNPYPFFFGIFYSSIDGAGRGCTGGSSRCTA